ncbi:ABC transporter ATP-binding protein [Ramlibacter sp. WS9]|uniref:ABC transporter ATP-binding protein n=1 Tax=Ramlibacter sp. WS9 TaxID=1882741 RepID=UPI001143FF37|nr:ABC transporter ATP-binding protein [Ramlibacter sp. WS9]ROZ64921.1 ABC transporter ATP-binding protein [Ramlibacter sp. WS9]
MTAANVALRADGLQVVLGGVEVLHGVTLALPAGRWTAIVGPNGAGKTTLLKSLAQLLPYQGRVQLQGRDAREWTHKARARTLAWLGQNEGGAEDLLAQDVVMLGRLPHQPWLGASNAQDHAAVRAAMQETQCWDWHGRTLGSLSGGERQRVLLARALAVQAPLLLMDEPLANLDPPHQADWLRIVRRHVERGGTAVSVLHEITMALHADEMVVMDAGRIVHQGACADGATHRALENVFQQRVAIHSLAGQWVSLPNE